MGTSGAGGGGEGDGIEEEFFMFWRKGGRWWYGMVMLKGGVRVGIVRRWRWTEDPYFVRQGRCVGVVKVWLRLKVFETVEVGGCEVLPERRWRRVRCGELFEEGVYRRLCHLE